MRIAIQGIKGSFHSQAAEQFFVAPELVECETFRDVFEAVKNGSADRGIVAIENSLHGSINPVYRLLAKEKLWICGEVRLKIELFLLAARQLPLEDWAWYDKVLSQGEAISQCEGWLEANFKHASVEETHDTAASVRWISRYPDEPAVAIASKMTADLYEVNVLAGPINDDPDNYTRFVVLAPEQITTKNADRTSIILTESTQDKPGTLVDALNIFKDASINLSKLDSHPLPGEKRTYSFYIDFDESHSSPAGKKAIQSLEKSGWDVQILGSYKRD